MEQLRSPLQGSGIASRIVKWQSGTGLTSSSLLDSVSGGVLTLSGTLTAGRTITVPDAAGTLPLLEAANVWTTTQRINASEALGLNAAVTGGNGLLQFASGTTKANGISFGTDTFLFRVAANALAMPGALYIGEGSGSGDLTLEVGHNRTADGNAYIDLIATSGGTDYNARLLRASGANGATVFAHTGTGDLRFKTENAAPILLETSNTERARVDSSGNVGIGMTPSAGNGLLQLASGTTKANGISFGTDTFLFRAAANELRTNGLVRSYVASGIQDDNLGLFRAEVFDNNSASVTVRNTQNTGQFMAWSTNGIRLGNRVNSAGTGHLYFTVGNDVVKWQLNSTGDFHLRGGTPATPASFTAWTGTATRSTIATGSATTANCAEAIKALIDDLKTIGVLP